MFFFANKLETILKENDNHNSAPFGKSKINHARFCFLLQFEISVLLGIESLVHARPWATSLALDILRVSLKLQLTSNLWSLTSASQVARITCINHHSQCNYVGFNYSNISGVNYYLVDAQWYKYSNATLYNANSYKLSVQKSSATSKVPTVPRFRPDILPYLFSFFLRRRGRSEVRVSQNCGYIQIDPPGQEAHTAKTFIGVP